MEGSGLGSAGCVVHAVVHGECVVLWVATTQLLLSIADVCLVCRSCGVPKMLMRKLCCKIDMLVCEL